MHEKLHRTYIESEYTYKIKTTCTAVLFSKREPSRLDLPNLNENMQYKHYR